jgi:hypothetical protein
VAAAVRSLSFADNVADPSTAALGAATAAADCAQALWRAVAAAESLILCELF